VFIKRTVEPTLKLVDIVPKVTRSGFLLWNINDDLGTAADDIARSTPQIKMAYGYARRTAAAAMHLQGLVTRDVYIHVCGIFRALQQQTGHSVEFQEEAWADSIEFMQTYHYLINSLFARAANSIASGYNVPSTKLSDPDLFKEVMDTVYAEQEQQRKK